MAKCAFEVQKAKKCAHMDALKLITSHSDKGVIHPKPLDPLYLTTCNSHQIRFFK